MDFISDLYKLKLYEFRNKTNVLHMELCNLSKDAFLIANDVFSQMTCFVYKLTLNVLTGEA